MAPTITVVTPTFNRLRFLREALESALKQTRVPDEILVVDDGSTDGTEEFVKGLPSPVRYIRQKNAGPSAARNRAFREAKSDWIALLDSDDLWLPNKLQLQLDFLAAAPAVDFVFGNQVNMQDGVRESAPEILNQEVYRRLQAGHADIPDFFSLLLQINPIPTSSVMFRRSCLEKTGSFDERRWRCEDYDLWLRFAANFRIGFLDEILVAKRRQGDNLINDYLKLWSAHLDVLRNLPPQFPQRALPANPEWRLAVAHTVYRLGSFQLSRGEKADAKRWFGELKTGDLPAFSKVQALACAKKTLLTLGLGGLAKTARTHS